MFLARRIDTLWSKDIDKFWSEGISTVWAQKSQNKNINIQRFLELYQLLIHNAICQIVSNILEVLPLPS